MIMSELLDLIKQGRNLKEEISEKNSLLKKTKEKIREIMIDSGLKEFEGVQIRRVFSSFDLELLRLEHPKVFERFATREEHTITTFENKITKKNLQILQKEYPEL